MIVAGTGHRPDKLFPGAENPYSDKNLLKLYNAVMEWLWEHRDVEEVISGMALGFDTVLAMAALEMDIPLTAAVPFTGQESRWPQESRMRYNRILEQASSVKIVSAGKYAPWKMQVRNEWMVDNATDLLTAYNGDRKGGTFNCLKYAHKQGKPIHKLEWVW